MTSLHPQFIYESFHIHYNNKNIVNLIIHDRETFVESEQQEYSKVSRLGANRPETGG